MLLLVTSEGLLLCYYMMLSLPNTQSLNVQPELLQGTQRPSMITSRDVTETAKIRIRRNCGFLVQNQSDADLSCDQNYAYYSYCDSL